MSNQMNILFTTNANYAMPLTVCLTSLFENNKHRDIDVYILHSPLLEDQKNKMLGLAKSYGQKIHLRLVDEHYFNDAPTFMWTKEAYYRLLISEYLPKELDRILYIDCDTIVNKQLDNLYDMDLGDYCLAAHEEKNRGESNRSLTKLYTRGLYFNTGVIVFSLDKSRDLLNYNRILATIESLGKGFFMIDETIINIIFDGKIKSIDQKYNDQYITNFNLKLLDRLLGKIDRSKVEQTCIFHFTNKPWYNLYPGSCEYIWYKYLKLSPYKDLYTNKYSTIKYKVLRMSFVKLLLHEYITFSPKLNKLAATIFPEKIHKKLKDFYMQNIR